MPLTNSIVTVTPTTYSFFALEGAIFYRQQQLEIIERPGVTGSGVRRLGARGKPFQLVSMQFHQDYSAAKTALQAYDDIPGTDPVTLTRNGVDHGTYLVLEVLEIVTEPVLTIVADGVDPTYTVQQRVRWTLLG